MIAPATPATARLLVPCAWRACVVIVLFAADLVAVRAPPSAERRNGLNMVLSWDVQHQPRGRDSARLPCPLHAGAPGRQRFRPSRLDQSRGSVTCSLACRACRACRGAVRSSPPGRPASQSAAAYRGPARVQPQPARWTFRSGMPKRARVRRQRRLIACAECYTQATHASLLAHQKTRTD